MLKVPSIIKEIKKMLILTSRSKHEMENEDNDNGDKHKDRTVKKL